VNTKEYHLEQRPTQCCTTLTRSSRSTGAQAAGCVKAGDLVKGDLRARLADRIAEEGAGATRIGQVTLALEQCERLACGDLRFLLAPGGVERAGQRKQRLSVPHEVLGGCEGGDALSRETLRLGELTPRREDHRVGTALQADSLIVVRRGTRVRGEDLERLTVSS
jgi:hypothetical protein